MRGGSPSEAQLGSRDLEWIANQDLLLVNNSDIIQYLLCKSKPVSNRHLFASVKDSFWFLSTFVYLQ